VIPWSRVNFSRAALVAVLVLAAGCAPSLATMQPAHVAPKGHFQATAAIEIGAPTGTIIRIIDTGKTLSNDVTNAMMITPQQEIQIFEAGVNVAASPPSVGYHIALAYTLLDNFELNLRNAAGGWRVGSRYQLLHHENAPFDMVLGAGVSRAAVEIPLSTYIPILEMDDFTRYTGDVSLQIGTSRSFYRVWGGPKVLYSRFDTAMRLSVPGVPTPDLATFEGHAIYYGGLAGIAVGYRHVFLALELTVAELVGSADVTAVMTAANEPVARSADLSGLVFYPTFGFMGEF
jgi:hypothetical protein